MPGVAVLVSGGMDSCAMLADIALRTVAHPIYVRSGMAWEDAEIAALTRFLASMDSERLQRLTVLEAPVAPLLGTRHWTMSPDAVPEYDAPDETVYIPGRNITLLSLAAIWCSLNDVHEIAIGTLACNPFPDATPQFRELISASCSAGLNHQITVTAPMSCLHKHELLSRFGDRFSLHLTLTCSKPELASDGDVSHCGACNKCRERHEAYRDAGVRDRTRYRAAVP